MKAENLYLQKYQRELVNIMKPEEEFKNLLSIQPEKLKTPIIDKILYICCIIMLLLVIFRIPLKIWVIPLMKGEEITKNFYTESSLTIVYPKEYVRKRNDYLNFRFTNKDNSSFFQIRTITADEKTFSERAEKLISNIIRINNGDGINYEEIKNTSPDIALNIGNEETISLGSTEKITVSGNAAVLVIFNGTESYIAVVIIDYSVNTACLIEFVLTPDENNEQMIRDILMTLEVFLVNV